MPTVDVVLLFANNTLELKRAEWISDQLKKRGLHTVKHPYGSRAELTALLMEQHEHAKRVILFSKKTPVSTGEAFFTYYLAGFKPLPVRVENCPKHRLLSDIAYADIFGESEVKDVKQLERLVQAIRL